MYFKILLFLCMCVTACEWRGVGRQMFTRFWPWNLFGAHSLYCHKKININSMSKNIYKDINKYIDIYFLFLIISFSKSSKY